MEHGLPNISDLGKGKRTLFMPTHNREDKTLDFKEQGLKVLIRGLDLNLYARGGDLAYNRFMPIGIRSSYISGCGSMVTMIKN